MLFGHTKTAHTTEVGDLDPDQLWFDLYNPTRAEELHLEDQLGVLLPTREDMAEIETSSRLYLESGAAFMTAQIAYFGGEDRLQSGPVTFVLVKSRLVTIRYIDPASFAIFKGNMEKQHVLCSNGVTAFLSMLDVIIDRTADLIEKTEERIDALSKAIFVRKRQTRLEDALIQIGDCQNDIAKIRDSLVSLARLTAFAHGLEAGVVGLKGKPLAEYHDHLKLMMQDITSLSDHSSYVTGNMSFLLDAALGLISVEQNNVMKLISVVSVIFLPLTLIASIYGMNFESIPGLHNPTGFWDACVVMIVIAGGLLVWLKSQKWI